MQKIDQDHTAPLGVGAVVVLHGEKMNMDVSMCGSSCGGSGNSDDAYQRDDEDLNVKIRRRSFWSSCCTLEECECGGGSGGGDEFVDKNGISDADDDEDTLLKNSNKTDNVSSCCGGGGGRGMDEEDDNNAAGVVKMRKSMKSMWAFDCQYQIALLTVLMVMCSSLVAPVFSFNIDVPSVITHRGPSSSMFGFSVAMHRDSNVSWYIK